MTVWQFLQLVYPVLTAGFGLAVYGMTDEVVAGVVAALLWPVAVVMLLLGFGLCLVILVVLLPVWIIAALRGSHIRFPTRKE